MSMRSMPIIGSFINYLILFNEEKTFKLFYVFLISVLQPCQPVPLLVCVGDGNNEVRKRPVKEGAGSGTGTCFFRQPPCPLRHQLPSSAPLTGT